jgi:predicted GIY-YIG superfamily endonuclease
MPYFVYILRNSSNKLYVGQTNNLHTRIIEHINKDWKAAKFTKDNDDFKLVYSEEGETRLEAMHRETQLKGWSRAKKEALMNGDVTKLKELSKRKQK